MIDSARRAQDKKKAVGFAFFLPSRSLSYQKIVDLSGKLAEFKGYHVWGQVNDEKTAE